MNGCQTRIARLVFAGFFAAAMPFVAHVACARVVSSVAPDATAQIQAAQRQFN